MKWENLSLRRRWEFNEIGSIDWLTVYRKNERKKKRRRGEKQSIHKADFN